MNYKLHLRKYRKEFQKILSAEKEYEDKKSSQDDEFWLSHATRFPILHKIALPFLAISATSASVKRLFSCAGFTSEGNRTSLGPDLLEAEVLEKFNRKILKEL